jgi:protein-S-isoprenylcysteine O-methyltransferase Ste14
MATIPGFIASILAQSIVLLYPPVIFFWLIVHTQIRHWRSLGKRAYWIACLVWPLFTIPALYFREQIFSRVFEVRAWSIALGAAAIMLAFGIARQAAKVISLKTLVGIPELEPSRNMQPLLRSGIYSRTRNPVYLAHWLLILASAAWSGYAANWALFLLDTLLLPLMVRAEEQELLERYGTEFEDYRRAIPRFFPEWPW